MASVRQYSFRSAAILWVVVAMSLLRIVDLHWHRHLAPPCPSEACAGITVQYIADVGTPHTAQDQDIDISLVSDGLIAAALAWADSPPVFLALLPLLATLVLLGGPDVFPRLRSRWIVPAPPRRTLRPPLRAPPLLIS
ncbi:hypothetical protein RM530_09420 [Algiphilus sp. W345]|uniref:Uncharacterized protein n=1 Tax=Banduia mediterranea TaxID=3075609 RepID=A0ABU2WI86_9GAMM|nr:hypothetical protein [Algiphilus sp. W345]MDT0497580.1 hypothetical protein [Algiphilus sp. W345]